MKVLISGAGIAGPTLAYWLAQYGWRPTIVEKAPALRTGGYIIDFWGAGFEVADRMGLVPHLRQTGYLVNEVRVVDRAGRRIAGFNARVFSRASRGRFVSIPRGELAASIFRSIEPRVETIFGDTVTALEQTDKCVHVRFRSGAARDFELVVGADGLHSRIRELAFGPQSQFEKYLGIKAAAFEVEGYRPRDELVYVMYKEVGQQVARFAMRGDRTMFLFTFADEAAGEGATIDAEAAKRLLRTRFGNSGWECPQILNALDAARDLYFDRVSQIRMEPRPGWWTSGRVALIGDAAACPSLLAGEGSGLAMAEAYILAGELSRAKGDYAEGFARYRERLGPFVLGKQKAALRFRSTFAPRSRVGLFVGNRFMNLLGLPWIGELFFQRQHRTATVEQAFSLHWRLAIRSTGENACSTTAHQPFAVQ